MERSLQWWNNRTLNYRVAEESTRDPVEGALGGERKCMERTPVTRKCHGVRARRIRGLNFIRNPLHVSDEQILITCAGRYASSVFL